MSNVVWFRHDLRLADNPALAAAAANGPVIGLYVLDETVPPARRPLGGASRWWLHHSLAELHDALGGLVLLRGDPAQLVPEFADHVDAKGVYWNRRYDLQSIRCDAAVKTRLKEDGRLAESYNGSLLFEPWDIKTKTNGPFKVFSAFWRACLRQTASRASPAASFQLKTPGGYGAALADWALLPERPNWAMGFEAAWQPGEAGALARLEGFLNDGLQGYRTLRDRPDLDHVSRLSPHLRFGEISPRQVWAAAIHHGLQNPDSQGDVDKFLAEIGWREFSYHLLYHFPDLPNRNLNPAFDTYPWVNDPEHLATWQRGMTGYPLVDAGMRELWATGVMHNRVRMVTASFLTKHLRIHWQHGEAWFWDTLVDADPASNAASWQWVAGSGADAAPYFRIFNPTIQARKFDPDGTYIRRWCPELAQLPDRYIHAPFEAPAGVLENAGVVLGSSYPHPVVEHAAARAAALAGYETVKAGAD